MPAIETFDEGTLSADASLARKKVELNVLRLAKLPTRVTVSKTVEGCWFGGKGGGTCITPIGVGVGEGGGVGVGEGEGVGVGGGVGEGEGEGGGEGAGEGG